MFLVNLFLYFCAGEVFISYFESLDHESLERNLCSLFMVPVTDNEGYLSHMTIDSVNGLKLAIVERGALSQTARLHVVYVDQGH